MDRAQARQIAEAVAVGRIAIGIVALVAPTVPLRPWVGGDFAWLPRAKLGRPRRLAAGKEDGPTGHKLSGDQPERREEGA